MIQQETITGIILAGGKSSRMEEDKGQLQLNGKSFTQHIIDALTPVVANIIIVSSNSDYDIYNKKRVADLMVNSGPLAGLYTGLYHSETEFNMVLSCDVPLINTEILQRLIEASDDKTEVIQIESEGRTMPLIALYKRSCLHHLWKRLNEGERRLQTVINELNIKTLQLEPALQQYVKNINTKSDLKAIRNESND